MTSTVQTKFELDEFRLKNGFEIYVKGEARCPALVEKVGYYKDHFLFDGSPIVEIQECIIMQTGEPYEFTFDDLDQIGKHLKDLDTWKIV